ncbi:hypothetical protein, partial [Pseudovibrio sp. POLY-S9]|uniref:hypothetical protein n=1 Tax=Pseudovibrio sp. POLY-S9 TaxID=1576596 RepID=UPI00070ECAF0
MSNTATRTNNSQSWQQPYEDAINTLDGAALEARGYCIESPLPLAYQIKLTKIREMVCELADLDPRNGSEPLQLIVEHSQPSKEVLLPFKIGDRVFCRHLRTTGEIKSIALAADEDPQARILSLYNGKLSYNWVSMNDLEVPRGRLEEPHSEPMNGATAQAALSQIPLLNPT